MWQIKLVYFKTQAPKNISKLGFLAEVSIHQIKTDTNFILTTWQSRLNGVVIAIIEIPYFGWTIPLNGFIIQMENLI